MTKLTANPAPPSLQTNLPRNQSRSAGKLLLFVTLLLVISGCSSGDVPLGTVSGHVTKGGKPEPGITVKFDPVEGGRGSIGLTDANGYYDLTFSDRKGALLGKHNVVVEIRAKVNDAGMVTAPANVFITEQREVKSGSNTFDFEIAK